MEAANCPVNLACAEKTHWEIFPVEWEFFPLGPGARFRF